MKWTDPRFFWSHVRCNEVDWSQVYLIASNQSALCQTPTSWHRLFIDTYQYCICFPWGNFKKFLPFLNIWDFPPIFWEYLKHYWLCLVVKMFAKNKDSNKCIACPIKHFLLRCSSFTFCGTAGRLKPSQLNSPKVEPDTFHHHPEDFYYVFLANLVAGMVKGYRYE